MTKVTPNAIDHFVLFSLLSGGGWTIDSGSLVENSSLKEAEVEHVFSREGNVQLVLSEGRSLRIDYGRIEQPNPGTLDLLVDEARGANGPIPIRTVAVRLVNVRLLPDA